MGIMMFFTVVVQLAPIIIMVLLFLVTRQLAAILRQLKQLQNVKFNLHYPDEKRP